MVWFAEAGRGGYISLWSVNPESCLTCPPALQTPSPLQHLFSFRTVVCSRVQESVVELRERARAIFPGRVEFDAPSGRRLCRSSTPSLLPGEIVNCMAPTDAETMTENIPHCYVTWGSTGITTLSAIANLIGLVFTRQQGETRGGRRLNQSDTSSPCIYIHSSIFLGP